MVDVVVMNTTSSTVIVVVGAKARYQNKMRGDLQVEVAGVGALTVMVSSPSMELAG